MIMLRCWKETRKRPSAKALAHFFEGFALQLGSEQSSEQVFDRLALARAAEGCCICQISGESSVLRSYDSCVRLHFDSQLEVIGVSSSSLPISDSTTCASGRAAKLASGLSMHCIEVKPGAVEDLGQPTIDTSSSCGVIETDGRADVLPWKKG